MCNLHIKPIVSLPAAGRRHLDPEAGNLTERRPPSVEARKTIVRLCDEVNSARWTIPARGSSAKSESRCSARPSNPTIGARPILRRRSPSRLSGLAAARRPRVAKGAPPFWVPLVGACPLGLFLASPDALQCLALLPQQPRQFPQPRPRAAFCKRYPIPRALPSSDFGPVECSQGRDCRIAADCRTLRSEVQPFIRRVPCLRLVPCRIMRVRTHARGTLTSASASIQSCAESSDAFPCLHASRCFSRPAPFCDASHPICLASAWRC